MRFLERHIIKVGHQFYKEIDDLAWRSKNLYNYANYLVRQSFIWENKYLNNAAVFHLVKHHESYTALPRKVSNQVLMVLHRNWKSFFAAQKAYKQNPSRFQGRPKLPKYKDKDKGRNLVIYEQGAIAKPLLKKGVIKLSQTEISFPTKAKDVKADINASLNIIRKVVPAAFSLGIAGIAVCPSRITPGKVAI